MSDDVRWLTYDEAASELGITRESARQLAIRKRWERRKGNDNRARVGVPEAELQARTTDEPGLSPSPPLSDDTGHDPSVIQVLTRHISRLEAEIDVMREEREAERTRLQGEIDGIKAERDVERIRAAQVEALRGIIEAERRRTEDLVADRDALRADRNRWADQAAQLAKPVPAQVQAYTQPGWWPFRRSA